MKNKKKVLQNSVTWENIKQETILEEYSILNVVFTYKITPTQFRIIECLTDKQEPYPYLFKALENSVLIISLETPLLNIRQP